MPDLDTRPPSLPADVEHETQEQTAAARAAAEKKLVKQCAQRAGELEISRDRITDALAAAQAALVDMLDAVADHTPWSASTRTRWPLRAWPRSSRGTRSAATRSGGWCSCRACGGCGRRRGGRGGARSARVSRGRGGRAGRAGRGRA